MIVEAKISTVEGERYRLSVGGSVSMPVAAVQTACHWVINFESRQVTKNPLAVGDSVLAYFEGEGLSRGTILGLI